MFKELDRYLSEAELQRMIAFVDQDNSGTIDYEEFILHFYGVSKSEDSKEK